MSKKFKIVFEDDDEQEELTTLYSDGGMNKMTGDEAWGSVVQQDGVDIVGDYLHLFTDMKTKRVMLPIVGERTIVIAKFTDVAYQQNNGAELLAFVMALRIANTVKTIKCIKSDSELLIKSWSVKVPKLAVQKKMDKNKLFFINEAIKLRKDFESRGGVIEKVAGKDNKADLQVGHR